MPHHYEQRAVSRLKYSPSSVAVTLRSTARRRTRCQVPCTNTASSLLPRVIPECIPLFWRLRLNSTIGVIDQDANQYRWFWRGTARVDPDSATGLIGLFERAVGGISGGFALGTQPPFPNSVTGLFRPSPKADFYRLLQDLKHGARPPPANLLPAQFVLSGRSSATARR